MAPMLTDFTGDQQNAVHNSLSFGITTMGVVTKLSWLQLGNLARNCCTALTITGLDTMSAATMICRLQFGNGTHNGHMALTITDIVTVIAFCHGVRIFDSWVEASLVVGDRNGGYSASSTGATFSDVSRYVN